jgi:hypothetical protein
MRSIKLQIMKIQLLLFFICCVLGLQAQNGKFKVGILLNPNYSNAFYRQNGSVPGDVADKIKAQEEGHFGVYTNLFVQYALRNRWRLQFGLGYSQTALASAKQKYVAADPNDPLIPEYGHFVYKQQDIQIPMLLRFDLNKRKHQFYWIGGFTHQIKLKRNTIFERVYRDGRRVVTQSEDHSTEYKAYNINATIGLGMDFKLFEKLRWFLQPTFDCNLLGTSKSADLNRFIYTLGVSTGIVLGK